MSTELYVRLTHAEYKRLEEELRSFSSLETVHKSGDLEDQFYHKSYRFHLGDIIVEAHGPLVKP